MSRLSRPAWAIGLGLSAAILSPLSELLTRSPLPYLLVLVVLGAFVWVVGRFGRAELGLALGRASDHALAFAYPIIAVGAVAGVASLAGTVSPVGISGSELARDTAFMFGGTWLGVLITEEGFFRGALWGVSRRAGFSPRAVLIWTSLAFAAWHIAVPLIEEPFALPAVQLPVYLVNATLLGVAWGLLRQGSGSVVVACTAHATWNALVYELFGYGPEATALGLSNVGFFDPERGVLGIVVNAVVVVLLARWASRRATDGIG